MHALVRELRRRRQEGTERGFTLVEVLVATVLLTMVVGLSTAALINAIDQQSNIRQSTEAQAGNQVGMERLSRWIRQAVYPANGTTANSTIITTAEANRIIFTTRPSSTAAATAAGQTNAILTPIKRTVVQLVGTNLMWGAASQVSCPVGSPCVYGTPVADHVLIRGVRTAAGSSVCPANTGDGGVFHYYYLDSLGNWVRATNPVTDPTLLAKVTSVRVELFTQMQSGPRKPACVSLTGTIQMRNKL